MPGYKRIVSYIYTYEGGERKENTGFVKLEARDGECKAAIHMKGSYFHGQRSYKAYLYVPEKDSIQGMLLGELESRNGALEWKGSLRAEELARMPYTLDKIQGVFIEGSGGKVYASQWNDLPVKVDSFQIYQETRQEPEGRIEETEKAVSDISAESLKLLKKPQEEAETGKTWEDAVTDVSAASAELSEVPQDEAEKQEDTRTDVSTASAKLSEVPQNEAEKQEDTRLDVSVTSAELSEVPQEKPDKSEKQKDTRSDVSAAFAKLTQETVVTVQNKQETIQDKTASLTREGKTENRLESTESKVLENPAETSMAQEGSGIHQDTEEAFAHRGRETGNREISAGRKTDLRQEKWEYLARRFPVQRLFQSGKAPMACIRIGPRDLQRLPRGSWILGNNSFLLHGYYQYRHLLLCRQEEAGRMEYYLAVPGVYNEKEEMMANLFGFEEFHRIGNGGNRNGNYGYWFRRIEENVTDDNR